jgi:hypothetical protein
VSLSDPFDPESLRVSGEQLAQLLQRSVKPSQISRLKSKYLRGPIPWNWIILASKLPGKALAVGLLLWFWANSTKKRTVRFQPSQVLAMGMHPKTARRGLQALADSGLVSLRHSPGCCITVMILDFDPTET